MEGDLQGRKSRRNILIFYREGICLSQLWLTQDHLPHSHPLQNQRNPNGHPRLSFRLADIFPEASGFLRRYLVTFQCAKQGLVPWEIIVDKN